SGELDAAVSLRGPSANKHYTLVAGLKVKEGSDVDSVLREMLKDMPDEVKNAVSLDAESAGDVKIHRLNVQQAYDEDARKAFGDNPLYIALRSDALFVAGGEGGLSALKEAITARPGVVPPLELNISMARLVPLMGKKHKGDPAAAARKAFADAKDKDKLHITVEGGKTL